MSLELEEHPKWEKFLAYHEKNPEVLDRLARMAHELTLIGKKRTSIHLLVERLRWETYLADIEGDDGFKIPNDYKPLYARLIVEVYPEWTEMFEFRELTSMPS